MKNYQVRDKFFFAAPTLFPEWPYKSRLALGMRFSDFMAVKSKTYRFQVGETMYEIDSKRAKQLGMKYRMDYGALPNIIPLDEFTAINLMPPSRLPSKQIQSRLL